MLYPVILYIYRLCKVKNIHILTVTFQIHNSHHITLTRAETKLPFVFLSKSYRKGRSRNTKKKKYELENQRALQCCGTAMICCVSSSDFGKVLVLVLVLDPDNM
jgi:hypothetical protein